MLDFRPGCGAGTFSMDLLSDCFLTLINNAVFHNFVWVCLHTSLIISELEIPRSASEELAILKAFVRHTWNCTVLPEGNGMMVSLSLSPQSSRGKAWCVAVFPEITEGYFQWPMPEGRLHFSAHLIHAANASGLGRWGGHGQSLAGGAQCST